MTLGEWMEVHHLTDKTMAKLVGVSPNTIWRLRNNLNKPTAKTLSKLGEVTNGAVTVASFFPTNRNQVA